MEEKILVKRSIFKQQTYAKRYGFSFYNRRRGELWGESKVECFKNEEMINEQEIFVCDLEMPLLEIDEKFYIEELNQLVTITQRWRTSKDSVIYYIEPELIEDKESKIQLDKIKEEIIIIESRSKEKDQTIDELKEKFSSVMNKLAIIKNSFWGKFIKI